jgi:hypothetical protein
MTRHLVNREEQGKIIAQTSGVITMINDSHYGVKSTSEYKTYTVTAIKSKWGLFMSRLCVPQCQMQARICS